MEFTKTVKDNIAIYNVKPILNENDFVKLQNTRIKPQQIKLIIDHDADVYTDSGELLLKFRKNKISSDHTTLFYDNVISHALNKTSNRGSTTGSTSKNVSDNDPTMTNIFGFFDTLSPKQKWLIKQKKLKNILSVRQTRFNMDHPQKYENALPLIRKIDKLYKEYIPKKYKLQRKKADETPFKIDNTAFTTITTNVNFQTTIHKDKGDDAEGFGNLSVIERGEYTGGETCFPKYGVGVNVKTGDILFMDVHEWHANLPIKLKTKDAKRLSIVCYLRHNIWKNTKNKSHKFMVNHNKIIMNLRSNNKTKKNKKNNKI